MTRETPKWQTLWLLVGFGLLIGIGVVTVLLPELRNQPDEKERREPAIESEGVTPVEPARQE